MMNKGIIQKIAFITLLVCMIIVFSYKYLYIKDVMRNYESTYGQLISFHEKTGKYSNISINYVFFDKDSVEQKGFVVIKGFNEISTNFDSYKNKKYWVIYCPNKPSKNLINLNIEIQHGDNPKFPKNLNGFR